ncbi:uncharacterized protein LOC123319311 [Coccinella septempunctata]|uniref:uncharacterized protein LOC123319311 n=1 Tax=Coccinella septempunctata TaxID=41139 RepID=UPI001D08C659|nr:uncharacterized protein LOC123319311 [Coccinella septempunctata]
MEIFSNRNFSIYGLHYKFVKDIYEGSKLYEPGLSALPTFVFFISSFILLFDHFHRFTRRRTRWKTFIYRELGLQSSFFYLTRFWFIVMRLFKWTSLYFDDYVEKVSSPAEVSFNKVFSRFCIFCSLTSAALLPVTIMLVQYFFKDDIPNFLLWAGENRWMRTEMGPAGQLLENAPRFTIPSKCNKNGLSRRTASAEVNIPGSTRSLPDCVRNCRSMILLPNFKDRVIA